MDIIYLSHPLYIYIYIYIYIYKRKLEINPMLYRYKIRPKQNNQSMYF